MTSPHPWRLRAAVLGGALCLLPAARSAPKELDWTLRLDPYAVEAVDLCYPSGLRVVAQAAPGQPVFSLTSVVDRGASDDPPGAPGAAHLIEHLWFRARPGGGPQVQSRMADLGAVFNAYTTADHTTYVLSGPKAALGAALALEGARILDPLAGIEEETVKAEQRIVSRELEWRLSTFRFGSVLRALSAALPEGSPYLRALEMTDPKGAGASDLGALRAAAQGWYRPENVTLAVVGDLDVSGFKSLFEASVDPAILGGFGVSAAQCPQRRRDEAIDPPPLTPDQAPDPQRLLGPVERPTVTTTWVLPGSRRWIKPDPWIYLRSVGALYCIATRPEAAPPNPWSAYRPCGCTAERQTDLTFLVCQASVPWGEEDETLARFEEVWPTFSSGGVQRALGGRFERTRQWMIGDVFETLEQSADLGGLSEALAVSVHETGDLNALNHSLWHLASARIDEGYLLVSPRLTLDRGRSVILYPDGAPPALGEGALEEQAPEEPVRWEESAAEEGAEALAQAYKEGAGAAPDLGGVRSVTLESGLKIVILPYGESPRVRLTAALRGGHLAETSTGLSAASMLALTHSADGTRAKLRAMSAHLWLEQDASELRYVVDGSSANLPELVQTLSSVVRSVRVHPYFDSAVSPTEVQDLVRQTHGDKLAPEYWAWQEVSAHLPQGLPPWPQTDEDLYARARTLGPKEIGAYLERVFVPETTTLYVVGRVDPTQAEALLRGRFSDWSAAEGATPLPPVDVAAFAGRAPPEARALAIAEEDEPQAQVRVVCALPKGAREDDEDLEILRALLAGRIRAALREGQGVTYSPQVYLRPRKDGGRHLVLETSLAPAGVEGAVRLLLDQLRSAAAGDIPPQDLQAAKLRALRQEGLRYATNGQLTDALREGPGPGGEGWRLEGRRDRLMAVSAETVAAHVAGCAEHALITAVGEPGPTLAALKALDLDPELLDPEAEALKILQTYDKPGARKLARWEAHQAEARAESPGPRPADPLSAPPAAAPSKPTTTP